MWLYFNRQGQLIKSLEHGEQARAGTTAFSIYAVFEGIDSSAFTGYATIKLFKPDLYGSSYPTLLMKPVDKDFMLEDGETTDSVSPFQNNSSYHGFYFDFADFNSSQDTEILLDTDGLWRAVIVLIGSNLNVQGVATFNVEKGIVNEDGTDIDIDIVLFEILSEMKNKLNINKGIFVIDEDIDNIPEDTLADFENGQLFFNKYDLKMYELEITDGDSPTYTLVPLTIPNNLNIENGSGTGSLEQLHDGSTFNLDNPNSSRTGESVTIGATGQYATELGGKSKAEGKRAVAQGTQTIAQGNYSHAEGNNTISIGNVSHAEGLQTVASGYASHAEGSNTIASGDLSISLGNSTRANGYSSVSGGQYSIADTDVTVSLGNHTYVGNTDQGYEVPSGEGGGGEGGSTGPSDYSPVYSIALGDHTQVLGAFALAGGYYSKVNRAGQGSIVWGSQCEANGLDGACFGQGTKNRNVGQIAVGRWNNPKNNTLFEVGNGTANARSNAFEVYSDGHAEIGTMGSTNLSVATKEYVDGKVNDLKGSTLVTQGTFQNGKFEINFENTPLEDGLYFFTYGLTQTFVYITKSMLETCASISTPIRATIPVIYGNNGETQPGSLKIRPSSFYYPVEDVCIIERLEVSVANENHTVRDGFVMYIYKTNAI